VKSTKVQIFISVILYAFVASLLTWFGYTGIIYLVLSSALSIYWIYKGVSLYNKDDDTKWAKTMFGISLLVLMAMIALISIGGFLP
jgi:protoheme IX farnesyltransferase